MEMKTLKKGFLESIGAKFFTDGQGRKRVIQEGEESADEGADASEMAETEEEQEESE